MKKLLLLVAALSMTVFSLAACGDKKEDKNSTSTTETSK